MNPFDLSGKVALVTGAARGIGRACAVALAQAGADVIVGMRVKDEDSPVCAEIRGLGRKALPVQMDIAHLDQIRSAVAEAHAAFQHLDILVNNAGISLPNPAEDVPEADFDANLNVNLKGTFFTSQIAGKIMIEQRQGRIINISSQAGFVALANESVYCMTKAAIAHLTKCLALEWAPYHINVNAVAPTFIETPGTEKWLDDPDFRQSVKDRIPLGRVGDPMEVAQPVVFLASPAASADHRGDPDDRRRLDDPVNFSPWRSSRT